MNVQPNPTLFDADAFVQRQQDKSLLRFIACGSVDHGKSTLIGRLLYESGLVFADQLDALDLESARYGTLGEERDFALLLDGLAAEREQKITIDVAYRFFETRRRKFIVADAPGHEQYTRNMATGASTADLALLLISAAGGLTLQTRRHAVIVTSLGVRHLVVAINKMDLVGWSQSRFAALEAGFRAFARNLPVNDVTFVPLSAREGDNLVRCSPRMPWYRGPSLLEFLETVDIAPVQSSVFRMPVQCVIRPDAQFRGYGGLIAGGVVFSGMPLRVLPSEQCTHVARIVTPEGDLTHAAAGQAVTLALSDDIDVSRGDVLTTIDDGLMVSDRLRVRLVAVGTVPLRPGLSYFLKLGTATVNATLEPQVGVLDLATNVYRAARHLSVNDIGTAVITLDRPIVADCYSNCRELGSFILIDRESCDTVGLGLVESVDPYGARSLAQPTTTLSDLLRDTETRGRSIAKAISWRATGSLYTFILAAVITGSSSLAGGVALIEVLTKTALYYLHERVWGQIGWGRR